MEKAQEICFCIVGFKKVGWEIVVSLFLCEVPLFPKRSYISDKTSQFMANLSVPAFC